MTEIRRLAAIMAIDVVGYSRLMGEDEVGTAQAVREQHETTRPIIASHRGRVVKTMGDGVLLEFPSVIAAVECAIAVQKLMVERNADAPANKRIIYRIGVHLGDVLVYGEDILGEGVNIAARLEGIAEPDGICLSSSAFEHVSGKVEANFIDLGEKVLKNIAKPVRVYATQIGSRSPTRVPAATELGPKELPRLSIVVLPFANIGGDSEQEYFVDGVTENLTTDLSRIAGSFVIARNTAFTYKGKPVSVKQIGEELGVRYVLEGSVQRGGNRIRVNVQLIDAETGSHLWAERFDKPNADLFEMQDEIVARLANQLGTELVAVEARRAERMPSPDSLDLYFQGLACTNKGYDPLHLTEARSYFERARELDGENLDAMWGVALVDGFLAGAYMSDDRSARLASSEALVMEVLAKAPNHARAHSLLGGIQSVSNRAAQSVHQFSRAIALDRNLAQAYAYTGLAKMALGRAEETESHVIEALRYSPRDTQAYIWLAFAGNAKLYLGADKEAVEWLRRSIEINRNHLIAHSHLAAAFAHLGSLLEAKAEAEATLFIDPKFTIRRFRFGALGDDPTYLRQRERVIDGLRKAGLPEG